MDTMAQSMTFTKINSHIAKFNLADVEAAAAGSPAERLLTTFGAVRPILAEVVKLPLLAPTWRAALRLFVTTLDDVTVTLSKGRDFKAGKDL
jgi:hypothetical protein